MSAIPRKHLIVARVLHEDDDFMQIEVVKNDARSLDVASGDRFLTLVFVRYDKAEKAAETWLPWQVGDTE